MYLQRSQEEDADRLEEVRRCLWVGPPVLVCIVELSPANLRTINWILFSIIICFSFTIYIIFYYIILFYFILFHFFFGRHRK